MCAVSFFMKLALQDRVHAPITIFSMAIHFIAFQLRAKQEFLTHFTKVEQVRAEIQTCQPARYTPISRLHVPFKRAMDMRVMLTEEIFRSIMQWHRRAHWNGCMELFLLVFSSSLLSRSVVPFAFRLIISKAATKCSLSTSKHDPFFRYYPTRILTNNAHLLAAWKA